MLLKEAGAEVERRAQQFNNDGENILNDYDTLRIGHRRLQANAESCKVDVITLPVAITIELAGEGFGFVESAVGGDFEIVDGAGFPARNVIGEEAFGFICRQQCQVGMVW